jgi:hypothetical protein
MWRRLWLTQQTVSSHLPRNIRTPALTAVVLASLVVMAAIGLRASKGARVAPQAKTVVASDTIRFTIYPEGIEPATATVSKGAILISIEDLADARSGVLVERLGDREPAIVGNVQRSQGHWRGRSLVELTPGVYRLRVPRKQMQEAVLTVEP